jgi:hypothetical protein
VVWSVAVESYSTDLYGICADNSIEENFVKSTLGLLHVSVGLSGVGFGTLSGQFSSKIVEDTSLWVLVPDSSRCGSVKFKVFHSDCSCTRVSRSAVEAVGTGTEGCSCVKVVVEELSSINGEVFCPWAYDTVRRGVVKSSLSVLGLTDNESVHNLCVTI